MVQLAKPRTMDKPIKLGEFIMSFLIFIGMVASGWATIKSDASTTNVKVQNLEQNQEAIRAVLKEMNQKMDSNNDRVMDKLDVFIRELSKKQDRKG